MKYWSIYLFPKKFSFGYPGCTNRLPLELTDNMTRAKAPGFQKESFFKIM
jgi:hypothetical protein